MDDFARSVLSQVKTRLAATVDVNQIEEEPPPPPEPVEEPEFEPDVVEPPPDVVPTEQSEPLAEDYEPPPPEAAKAGQVLTSDPQPDEPLDLTDNTMITGSSDSYSGGNTTSTGTSDAAVRNRNVQPGGIKGGQGTRPVVQAKAPPAVDKSRPARLTPGANSSRCRFPSEAMAEQVSQMDVRVLVVVGSDGKPTSSSLRGNDPGLGFARRAKECAMRASFIPGWDKYGKPSTTTITMNIKFRL
jgi:outer membrane biosynthesis protein TonB